jgi:hypothetical protein
MENTTPAQQSANPLSKYFRQPAIYFKLPSQGRYWEQGALDLPVTGEIPVYPMTARDEIVLRTPDALLSGVGVVDVIKSCCPSIVDAWKMPSIDLDATLIAIRIASYGHAMDVDTKCPHCEAENAFSLDLRPILASIACPDYDTPVHTHDLDIKLVPQLFFGINRAGSINFEEQKILNAVSNADLSEDDKQQIIRDSMERLMSMSIDTVTKSTESITTNDGTVVTDRAFITDFYKNADSSVIRNVQKRLGVIASEVAMKPQKTNCSECGKEYSIPLDFNYSSFFAIGS